jgi:hypothetical protein
MSSQHVSTSAKNGRVLGVPLGDFGLFASVLMAAAVGFLIFFLTCFVAIFAILIYNGGGHHSVNFADSYRLIAFPVGLTGMVLSLIFFVGHWVRRKVSGR